MQTVCIHCGQAYAVDDQQVGQTVPCQNCGNYFTIAPAAPQQMMPNQYGGQMPAGGQPYQSYPQPAKSGSGLALFLILGGVFLFLLIVGGVVGVVLLSSSGEDDSVAEAETETLQQPANRPDVSRGPSSTNAQSGSASTSGSSSQTAADASDATDEPDAPEVSKPGSWSTEVGPEPDWPELADRPFVIRPVHAGQVQFAGPPSARVATFNRGAQEIVSVYSLTEATRIADFEVPRGSSLVAISPDGARVVVANGKDYQLWTISGNTAEKTGEPFTSDSLYSSGSRSRGQFISADKILLPATSGLQMYTLPDWKPGYLVRGGTRAMSPDRKYLASGNGRDVSLSDLETGTVVGQLEQVPDIYRGIGELAFRPDGKVLAANGIYDDYEKPNQAIVLWDLTSGKLLAGFDVPTRAGPIQWCDSRYLLVGTHLVDTQYQGAVWHYTGLSPVAAGPDGRVWYQYRYGGQWLLASSKLPNKNALTAIPSDLPPAVPILNDGDRVSLQVSFNASPPADKSKGDIAQHLRSGIENSGHPIADAGAPPVRVVVSDKRLGEDRVYEEFEFGIGAKRSTGVTFTVPNRALAVQVEVGSGRDSWKYEKLFHVPTSSYDFDEDDSVSGSEGILNERWDNLEHWVKSFSIPSTVYSNTPRKMFGESQLRPELELMIAATKAGPASSASSIAWSATPDPLPVAPESLRWTGPVPLGKGSGEALMLSHPHLQHAALYFEESFGRNHHLARYHLGSGKQLAAIEVTRDTKLLDFRPDAQLMIVQPKGQSVLRGESIEIWKCTEDAHETMFEWEPYGEERFNDDVKWAVLVGRNLIWTANREKADLWTLPDKTLVHSMSWSSDKPIFSHNRRYMVAPGQQPVTYDAASGKVVGYLASPTAFVGAPLGGSFSPDGKVLAALFRGSNSNLLVFWDFATGQLRREVEVPSASRSTHFCSDRFVLVGKSLYDIHLGSIIWSYPDLYDPAAGVGPAVWFFKRDSQSITHLVGLPIPSEKVFKAIEEVAGSQKPLLKAGEPLNLKVDSRIRNRPDHNERQQVRDILTTKLEASGHAVSSGQDVLLNVNVEEKVPKYPETVTAFSDGKKIEVPNEQLEITLELSDLEGESLWKRSHTVELDFSPLTNHVDFDELRPRALQQRWDRLYQWLESVETPSQFYVWDLTGGIGKSTYGKSGEEVQIYEMFR